MTEKDLMFMDNPKMDLSNSMVPKVVKTTTRVFVIRKLFSQRGGGRLSLGRVQVWQLAIRLSRLGANQPKQLRRVWLIVC